MNGEPKKYYGKYRATVINNVDPMNVGRLQVQVHDVGGPVPATWALPCLPVASPQMGTYLIPTIGSGVWVEFEQGDLDHPIWVGCFWGSAAEVPSNVRTLPPALPSMVLQTTGQHAVIVSDAPSPVGGVQLKSMLAKIIVDDTGILISNGMGAEISLIGNTVTINKGALVVV